jgi:hypothetical protein
MRPLLTQLLHAIRPSRKPEPPIAGNRVDRLPVELRWEIGSWAPSLPALDSFSARQVGMEGAPRWVRDRQLGSGVTEPAARHALSDLIQSNELKTVSVIGPHPGSKVTDAHLLQDGRMLVVYGRDGFASLVKASAQNQELKRVDFGARVELSAVSANGKRALAMREDGRLCLHDLESGARLRAAVIPAANQMGARWRQVGLSANGERAFFSLQWEFAQPEEVYFFDRSMQEVRRILPPEEMSNFQVQFEPHGTLLVSSGNRSYGYDSPSAAPRRFALGGAYENLRDVEYSADGRSLAVVSSMGGWPSFGHVSVRSPHAPKLQNVESSADGAAFTPDGNFLLTSRAGKLETWDLRDLGNRAARSRPAEVGQLRAVSADGHALSASSTWFKPWAPPELKLTSAREPETHVVTEL